MSEFQEFTDTIEVPLNTGIEGFIHAIRQLLKRPRVTSVHIDTSGKVTFTRFVRPEEPRKHFEVDFEEVAPSYIIRNVELQEIDCAHILDNAAVCISAMFWSASLEQMYPVAFVVGANSSLGAWHKNTTGIILTNNSAYGFPILRDRHIPDDALILTTAFARGGSMSDVKKSYKITMPSMDTVVRELPLLDVQGPVIPASDEVLVLAEPPAEREVKSE